MTKRSISFPEELPGETSDERVWFEVEDGGETLRRSFEDHRQDREQDDGLELVEQDSGVDDFGVEDEELDNFFAEGEEMHEFFVKGEDLELGIKAENNTEDIYTSGWDEKKDGAEQFLTHWKESSVPMERLGKRYDPSAFKEIEFVETDVVLPWSKTRQEKALAFFEKMV